MATVESLIVFFIEGFLSLGAGLGILGIRLNLRHMGLLSCLYSLITYGVRKLYALYNIPFGTHTFIILGIFALFIVFIGKQKILDSILSVIVSLSLMLLGESFFLFPILNFLGVDFTTLTTRIGGTLLLALAVYIPLIIAFCFCYVLKFTVINMNHFKNVNRL
ncbi:hypothetical protein HNQ80_004594 [Anaerosolibacter carboniphilus]|uniref:Uncharacterized protein n=1 Tax=Anaerosolibacter carboniphilus TaxID=1417629 RepID=A0A841L2M9_9FIRM|nr:hypothetical protein [Anaerosolibacter carboniphilus]MBB6218430.1 hypothetical protein [Anaerosolibacter carboniphilus]